MNLQMKVTQIHALQPFCIFMALTWKQELTHRREELKETGVKGATDKVKDAATGAFDKVKGLFKKKK